MARILSKGWLMNHLMRSAAANPWIADRRRAKARAWVQKIVLAAALAILGAAVIVVGVMAVIDAILHVAP